METLCLQLWEGHLYTLRRARVQVLNLEGPHTQYFFWRIFHYHIIIYWPFARVIHLPSLNSPHKGQWCWDLIISLTCAWTNSWVNSWHAGDMRHLGVNYDVTVMFMTSQTYFEYQPCTQYVSSYVMFPTSQTHFACQTMHVICIIIYNVSDITESLCMSTMHTVCIIICNAPDITESLCMSNHAHGTHVKKIALLLRGELTANSLRSIGALLLRRLFAVHSPLLHRAASAPLSSPLARCYFAAHSPLFHFTSPLHRGEFAVNLPRSFAAPPFFYMGMYHHMQCFRHHRLTLHVKRTHSMYHHM